jgi:uncharacterized DUF497 family protein
VVHFKIRHRATVRVISLRRAHKRTHKTEVKRDEEKA